ncbi:MAG: sigma-70 family RNA polymerase sigma factor [Candidatus Latescibacterota bacterium]
MTVTPLSDAELVKLARSGDESALTDLVDRHSSRLYTLLKRMLRNEDDAQDALQETFIAMIEKFSTFRGDSQFYTWLYRIASNIVLMRARGKQNPRMLSLDEDAVFHEVHEGKVIPMPSQPDRDFDDKELRKTLDTAIGELPLPLRTVFILRDVEQLSVKETAKVVRISEDNVKTRLRRARLMLRNLLAEKL